MQLFVSFFVIADSRGGEEDSVVSARGYREKPRFLPCSLKGVGDVSDGGGSGGNKLTGDY